MNLLTQLLNPSSILFKSGESAKEPNLENNQKEARVQQLKLVYNESTYLIAITNGIDELLKICREEIEVDPQKFYLSFYIKDDQGEEIKLTKSSISLLENNTKIYLK